MCAITLLKVKHSLYPAKRNSPRSILFPHHQFATTIGVNCMITENFGGYREGGVFVVR